MNDLQAGRGWKPATSSGREILVIGLGLVLILGLLAGALPEAKLPESSSPSAGAVAQGAMATTPGPAWLLPVLQTLFLFAAGGAAVGLLTREGRRETLLRVAVGLGLVALALAVLLQLTPPGNVAVLPSGPVTEPPSPAAPPRGAAPDTLLRPPAWATLLAAMGLAAVLAWCGWGWR